MILRNHPDLWVKAWPHKTADSHKYKHGHALIYGAPSLTGATRLVASACARMGAGLVTVLADDQTADIYRVSLPAHILVRDDLQWDDPRVTTRLYGSGGLAVAPDFSCKIPVILDADALYDLPDQLSSNYILTPHDGEFERAFPSLKTGERIEETQRAAKATNACIVRKGGRTVIAAPDGRVIVNEYASPYLATAGTGDVLAGMIAGLTAQNMPVFDAIAAAVWVHGACSMQRGAGLVASDLPDMIPYVLRELF